MSAPRRATKKSSNDVVAELNPQRAEDDRKNCEIALSDPATREILELAWYAILNNGECLRKEACDLKHFRVFVVQSKYGSNDRHLSTALHCFDGQQQTDETIDFKGFVKVLFHMGMLMYSTDDYAVAMQKMIDFVKFFYEQYKIANEHDGSGPDDRMLDIPEIDRLLYVYDAVFERLFNRYKDVDQHANRELTLEQLKILDQFVEVEEVKEMLKDYGYFPKYLSYVEISRCCQFACFGKLVVDPTRQGGARFSSISEAKKDVTLSPAVAVLDVPDGPPSDEGRCTNPLFLPMLPAEYMHDEALLDKPRFMSCFMRLGQTLYSRPEYTKKLPSICSRIEEMLTAMMPMYDKMFCRPMDQDCDFTEKGVPVLLNTAPSAALVPARGLLDGGFELNVQGSNFCEKRGVFVRFGEGESAIIVRSKQIQKKKVVVDAPRVKHQDTVVEAEFQHGEYIVELQHIAKLRVECSNNRWQYSVTEPGQIMTFFKPLPKVVVDEPTSAKLMKLFSAVCAVNDRYNTKYLSREKWRKVKGMCNLKESLGGAEQDNDVFFLEVAEYHEGVADLSLDFKSYLRVIVRTLYQSMGEAWVAGLMKVAEVTMGQGTRGNETIQRLEEDEITIARRAIDLVEHRTCKELDVFLGPVHCGVLRQCPGDITSVCMGKPVLHRKNHPFLSYEHHEINSESIILGHIRVAQSFVHLINRLLQEGFDLACHHKNSQTRKPAGRCWSIARSGDGSRVGALWDYPGNYSNLEWQPAHGDMVHDQITLCFYAPQTSTDYVVGFILFSKADSISHLRALLAARGYNCTTKLYKLP